MPNCIANPFTSRYQYTLKSIEYCAHNTFVFYAMPKRKAATTITGLVDSDDDIPDLAVASHSESLVEHPAKKARGRPKSAGGKGDDLKSAPEPARASAGAMTKQNGARNRVSQRGRPRATTAEPVDTSVDIEAQTNTRSDSQSETTRAQFDGPEQSSPVRKRRGRPRESDSDAKQKLVTEDGEFEYTPTGMRHLTATEEVNKPRQSRGRQRKSTQVREAVIPDSQSQDPPLNETESPSERAHAGSPLKSLTNGEKPGRKRATVTFVDTVDKTSSDPDLRRKLGDMTKKYETLEAKFRNLREIGILEANANFEKIRKQCESATNGKIIANLKRISQKLITGTQLQRN